MPAGDILRVKALNVSHLSDIWRKSNIYVHSVCGPSLGGIGTHGTLHSLCAVHAQIPFTNKQTNKWTNKTNKTNSVALSWGVNYTNWATATCRRNLVPTFVDRGVSRGQRGGSPTVINKKPPWPLVRKRTILKQNIRWEICWASLTTELKHLGKIGGGGGGPKTIKNRQIKLNGQQDKRKVGKI
jgi:hypothetical protein